MIKPIQGIFYRDFKTSFIPEILKELYRDRVYDHYLLGKKDLTMIDLGANIGLWSQYAYPFAKTIYAVEPAKEHFEVMTAQFHFNKLTDRIVPINKAVSHKSGTAKFYHNNNVTMYSLRSEVNDKNDFEEVELITLPQLFDEYNIKHVDFIKLDVEGSECELIGGSEFDKVADKIDTIVGEYHTWSGVHPHQLQASFEDRGFKFEWLNRTEASLFSAIHK